MKRAIGLTCILAFILLCPGPASSYDLRYPPQRWLVDPDRAPQLPPSKRLRFDPLDGFLLSTEQDLQAMSSAFAGVAGMPTKYLPGMGVEAIDTNNFEEVADSAWFANRIGRFGADPAAVRKSLAGCGPDLGGPLVVREAATGRASPTILAEDRRGTAFIVHFDPADAPGHVSSPATAAALILANAGYPVAIHCPVTIDRGALTLGEGARLLSKYGKSGALTQGQLASFLKDLPAKLRAVAIRLPEGRPVGHFAFAGRRSADHNDRLRHQDRRELRGLRLFSAFIGWISISNRTTYDAFVAAEGGRGLYDHWLLNLTDVRDVAETFNPSGFGASLPNEAFALMTPKDAFWAARLIGRFSDPLIDAIVAAAQYPEAKAAHAAAAGLKARRDSITRKWFAEQSPLDDFRFSAEQGALSVSCTDLSAIAADPKAPSRRYRARLTTPFERAVIIPWRESEACAFSSQDEAIRSLDPGRVYELWLQARDEGEPWWPPAVKLLVRARPEGAALEGLQWRVR